MNVAGNRRMGETCFQKGSLWLKKKNRGMGGKGREFLFQRESKKNGKNLKLDRFLK